ncbi:MAG: hypothetical protein QM488_09145 [Rhizobiaceae bacterium]
MKKRTLLLAGVALFSFANAVTATDHEPNKIFESSGYSYSDYGDVSEPKNCAFQFSSIDGSTSCISGKPSGWNRPKSDYWESKNSYEVIS